MHNKIILQSEKQKEINLAKLEAIENTYREFYETPLQDREISAGNIKLIEKHVCFYLAESYESELIDLEKGPFKLTDKLVLYGIDSAYTLVNPELFSKGFVFKSSTYLQGCSFVWLEAVIEGQTKLISYHDSSDKLENLSVLLDACRANNWELKGGVIFSPIRARPKINGFPFKIYKYPFIDDKKHMRTGSFNFIISRHGVILLNEFPNDTTPFTRKLIPWSKIGWRIPEVRDSGLGLTTEN